MQNSSIPTQITKGFGEDTHASFVNSDIRCEASEEWLAFSRRNSIGSNILLIKSNPSCNAWIDTIYRITDDSVYNDFPTLARAFYGYSNYHMMLVWRRGGNLYYSYKPADIWLPIQALTHDSVTNNNPCIAPSDSGFILTWEREGQIFFSGFSNGMWSPPYAVTPTGDSTNFLPQIASLSWNYVPLIIWEKVKTSDSSRAIYYSLRKSDGSWRLPDTLQVQGDNRHPRFAVRNYVRALFAVWESCQNDNWDLYGISGYLDTDKDSLILLETPANLTPTDDLDERECSFIFTGILTRASKNVSQNFSPEAATWRNISGNNDDIAISQYAFYMPEHYSITSTSIDRSPLISSGVFINNFLRVWYVWESDGSGTWKLYGTYKDIIFNNVEDIKEDRKYFLYQNYPNPFNPSTTIKFDIPEASFVTLKIYNILAQEVATLVNENKKSGRYEIKFDGSKLTSGVYLCRISITSMNNGAKGEYSVFTNKMILLK